ncbi:MAG: tetratricopeptide repeat protein [Saccharothrix sp.]|nr:tetratricopeptide repeat protein [Saccharothrix sp.]
MDLQFTCSADCPAPLGKSEQISPNELPQAGDRLHTGISGIPCQREAASVEFTILGRTGLRIGGNGVKFESAKQRALLAILLFHVRKSVSTDLIGRALWRESPPHQVSGKLQPQLSKLRKLLKEVGVGDRIARDGTAYRLDVDPLSIDYHRFRKLAEKGRAAATQEDHRTAKALLQEALDLWRGEPLLDVVGPWADHIRDQLEMFDRLIAQQALIDSRLHLGEHAEVVGEALRLTEDHLTDETCARLYLESLHGLGKYSHAVEFHERFSDRLFDHHGVVPGPELRNVYRAIRRKQSAGDVESDRRPALRPDLLRRINSFAGRTELLARLDSILAEGPQNQVVVLHGMPGVGKTQLATQWAYLRADHFPDGVTSLDLHGFGPGSPLAADDALGILLTRLGEGPVPASAEERRVRLRSALDDRRFLLLLDNARDDRHVKPILDATPSCFVLVTGRTQPFDLSVHEDAHVVPVPPLSAEESTAVLRAVIGSRRAAEDPAAVDELVRLATGLPLAVRIIGQHVDHRPETPLADLVEEFTREEGLGVLGSAESGDEEGRGLRAAFSWSYRSLPAETARMFRLLGLHPTTEFSTAAAGRLLGEPESTAERHLRTLGSANLAQHVGTRRFRLHDLLHDHAFDLVERDEPAADRATARRRVLDHYLSTAVAAWRGLNPGLDPVPALDGVPVTEPFDNDEEALDWFSRERANLVAAVVRAADEFPEHSWRLTANLHGAFLRLGHFEDLMTCQAVAVEVTSRLTDKSALAGTLTNSASVHYRLHRYDEAVRIGQEALAVLNEADQPKLKPVVLANLASAHLDRGEIGHATTLFGEARALAARTDDMRHVEAASLERLGLALHRQGRPEEALDHYQAALKLWESIASHHGRATVLGKLIEYFHENHRHAESVELLDTALEAIRISGDQPLMVTVLAVAAEAHYALGDFDQAITMGERAVAFPETGADDGHARALHATGHALVAIGEVVAAEEKWSRAARLYGTDTDKGRELLDHLHALRRRDRSIPDPRRPDEVMIIPCQGVTLRSTG